jgi:phosphatidate cytidylyltransferase
VPGYWIPLFVIASIWVNDTMAYLIGSLIGRTPLSKISPKKTWEGTAGGALVAVLFCGFVVAPLLPGYEAFPPLWRSIQPFALAAIAAVVGTLGDLLESKLKRLAGVKDSGQLMPGHGGFLDRFDSLLLAATAVFIYLHLTKTFI